MSITWFRLRVLVQFIRDAFRYGISWEKEIVEEDGSDGWVHRREVGRKWVVPMQPPRDDPTFNELSAMVDEAMR